ncbi:hypothetical protein ACFL03_06500 [Thermodesulfobacteriota bacterium]
MSLFLKHKIIGFILSLIFIKASAWACVTNYPKRLITSNDTIVLEAPVGIFQEEIERVRLPDASPFKAVITFAPSDIIEADVIELSEALKSKNIESSQIDQIVSEYLSFRKTLLKHGMSLSSLRQKNANQKNEASQVNLPAIPEGLPIEFSEYLKGAFFYYQGQPFMAINAWMKVLERPRPERIYRSTWAAFMIGKVLLKEYPESAVPWFKRVRLLVKKGYADSLGLASSSLGWEARALLDQNKCIRAINLYARQLSTGDTSAVQSLKITADRALKADPEVLKEIAGNTLARKVLTALVVSHRSTLPFNTGPFQKTSQKWLSAVEAAGVSLVQEADRLAWSAYQIGNFEAAQRWIGVAPKNSIITRFIRAKLLLRDGNITEAISHLEYINKKVPPVQEVNEHSKWDFVEESNIVKRVCGELGVLYLAQEQFVKSYDALLNGGFWEDACYVAERILSSSELKIYVDLNWPGSVPRKEIQSPIGVLSDNYSIKVHERIRHLLARRLAREGRWEEARTYYPLKLQLILDEYIAEMQKGSDKQLSNQERAKALWEAALIARYKGMEILGTEVEPDWFVYRGNYQGEPASLIRSSTGLARIVQSSPDEKQRLRQNIIHPDKRFHYRYIAAEHAWQAAKLMSNKPDETEKMLMKAASWLKKRDPKAADRFYKVLKMR